MLALRAPAVNSARSQRINLSATQVTYTTGLLRNGYFQPLATRSRRVLSVAVFAKKDKGSSKSDHEDDFRSSFTELQAYMKREEFLMAELAAVRSQVDKLLDQQQLLLTLVTRLSGLAGTPDQLPGVLGALPAREATAQSPTTHPPHKPGPPAAPLPWPAANSAVSAAVRGVDSRSSSSPDVPAPASLADLLRSAASKAANPVTAAAGSAVAAAIAAVDNGDILALENILPPQPPTTTTMSTPATAAASTASSKDAQSAPSPLPQPAITFDTFGGFTTAGSSSSSPPASPASSSSSPAAAASASNAGDPADLAVEVAKAAPTDPPPDLVQGDDDIFWMSKLHAALDERGFFPGDDDMENWFFGESTLAAVLTFQASVRLPETGVVDRATWTVLLGAEVAGQLYGREPPSPSPTSTQPPLAPSAARSDAGAESSQAAAAVSAASSSSPSSGTEPGSGQDSETSKSLTKWPVLMEGDGGREVHALQVALANSGFHCDEEDMRWWQFGDATLTALKFFQSCNGIPESGVCDDRTWRALMGDSAQPSDLYSLRMAANSDDEDGGFEDDLDGVSKGRVWLLGEQRWEKRG